MSQATSTQLIDPAASPVLDPRALFHTGLVVEDLEAATASLSALAGYHWTSVMELEVAARTEDGVKRFQQRFVLSLEEPRLELVEAIPGSVWVSNGANGAHHFGYWAEADRIAQMSDALAAAGLPVEVSNDYEADGRLIWVYHRGFGGVRIELLSTLIKPSMDAWVGGANADAVQRGAPA
jgi:hypothetical protein